MTSPQGGSDDAELRAIEAPDDDDGDGRSVSRSSGGRPSGGHEPLAGSQGRAGDGQVLATSAVIVGNPYGSEEDECCGVCLEGPAAGQLIVLWCCRNVLCVKDAQLVGACPFCREEPVMWDVKPPPPTAA